VTTPSGMSIEKQLWQKWEKYQKHDMAQIMQCMLQSYHLFFISMDVDQHSSAKTTFKTQYC